MKKPLAFIPARAGSKRFPGKHLALLGGKPLLHWSIDAALSSAIFAEIAVSSESQDILKAADGASMTHHRSVELAADHVPLREVCRTFCKESQWSGSVYVLVPTSPFRTGETIRRAWHMYEQSSAKALMSIIPIAFPPEWTLAMLDFGRYIKPFSPENFERSRLDLPPTFRHDGGHWIFTDPDTPWEQTIPFFPPIHETIDINTPEDLEYAEFLLTKRIIV